MRGKPSRLNRYDEYGFKVGKDDHITCHYGIGSGGGGTGGSGSDGGNADGNDTGGGISGDYGGFGGSFGGNDSSDAGDDGFGGTAGRFGSGDKNSPTATDGRGNLLGNESQQDNDAINAHYTTLNNTQTQTSSRADNDDNVTAEGTYNGYSFFFGLITLNKYTTQHHNDMGEQDAQDEAGFLGNLLGTVLGLSPKNAITAGGLAEAALAAVLGAPIGMVAPLARAAEQQGLISHETSVQAQAAGIIGGMMQGFISGAQTFGAISAAKSAGALSAGQAALLGAANAYGMYNGFTNAQKGLSSLGVSAGASDLAGFGVSTDGRNTYHNGTLITNDNFASIATSFIAYIAMNNSYSYDPEFDSFDKMAGGILLNNYLAGGTMWNPMNLMQGNYNDAVGISNSFSTFTQMTMLQEDYVGAVLAKNPS